MTTFCLPEFIRTLDVSTRHPQLMSYQPTAMIMALNHYMTIITETCKRHNLHIDDGGCATVLSDLTIRLGWQGADVVATMGIRDDGVAIVHNVSHSCNVSTGPAVFMECFCGLLEQIARGRVVANLPALVIARKNVAAIVSASYVGTKHHECSVISHAAMVTLLMATIDNMREKFAVLHVKYDRDTIQNVKIKVMRTPAEYAITMTFNYKDIGYDIMKKTHHTNTNTPTHDVCFVALIQSVCNLIIKKSIV